MCTFTLSNQLIIFYYNIGMPPLNLYEKIKDLDVEVLRGIFYCNDDVSYDERKT